MNLNKGDNQQKACFVMFRVDLNILLIVTIVEVYTLNLDICVSLHDPIQIISAQRLKNVKNIKTEQNVMQLYSRATIMWNN